MDPHLWELQQAAEERVERMREQSRRIAEQQGHRTAASLRAARPPYTPPGPIRPHTPPTPIPCADPAPVRPPDPERRMLLMLALLLMRSGASADLLLVLLYLAM